MNGALRVYLVPDLDIDLSQRSRLSDAMNHLETVAEVDLGRFARRISSFLTTPQNVIQPVPRRRKDKSYDQDWGRANQ
jgi:hypothetical protein